MDLSWIQLCPIFSNGCLHFYFISTQTACFALVHHRNQSEMHTSSPLFSYKHQYTNHVSNTPCITHSVSLEIHTTTKRPFSSRPSTLSITFCWPRCKSRICGPFGAPPYTHVFFILDDDPNLVHSCWICTASSRVGAMTKTIGPSPGAATPNDRWQTVS